MKKSKIDEVSQESFFNNLDNCAKNPYMVAVTSAVLHIIDEVEWGLLPESEAEKAARLMIVEGFGFDKEFLIENDSGSVQASILQFLTKAISESVLREMNC
jgi:hypothetical protein